MTRLVDFAHTCGTAIGIQLGHCGRKLGADGFGLLAPAAGWWLDKRAQAVPDVEPSTYRANLENAD